MTEQTEMAKTENIIEMIMPHKEATENLIAQVSRVEIDSAEVQTKAGDLMKLIKTRFKSVDELRKSIVQPFNKQVKWINDQFRPYSDQLKDAEKDLRVKMNEFARKEEEARKAAEAAARKAAEEEALKRAEAAEQAGDTHVAEALLDHAVETKVEMKSQIKRGDLGASTSTKKVVKFDVTDIKELCRAIADGKVSTNAVTVNEKWIRAGIAKKKAEENGLKELLADGYMAGVRFYEDVSVAVR